MAYVTQHDNQYVLSSELGYSTIIPTGLDVLAVIGTGELPARSQRLRQAIGHMCHSSDPDVQIARTQIDFAFAEDTRGAPDDFPFATEPGESITVKLARSNDAGILRFALWNRQRISDLTDTITANLPTLRTDVENRANRLYQAGILPRFGLRSYEIAIRDIASNKMVGALDSFEGSIAAGIFDKKYGLFFRHLFDDGYAIGAPTQQFYDTGMHETGHKTRNGRFFKLGSTLLLTEFLVEYQAAISSPGDHILETPLQAASHSGYRPVMQLFGTALEYGPNSVSAEQLGEAVVTPGWGFAYHGVAKALRQNFNHFFPNEDNAFKKFITQFDACTFGHQAADVTYDWLGMIQSAIGIQGNTPGGRAPTQSK